MAQLGVTESEAVHPPAAPSTVGPAPEPSETLSPMCTGIGRCAAMGEARLPHGLAQHLSGCYLHHTPSLINFNWLSFHPNAPHNRRVHPLISAEPESAFLPFPETEAARRSSGGGSGIAFASLKQRRISSTTPTGSGAQSSAGGAAPQPSITRTGGQMGSGGIGAALSRLGSTVANLMSGGGAAPAVQHHEAGEEKQQ